MVSTSESRQRLRTQPWRQAASRAPAPRTPAAPGSAGSGSGSTKPAQLADNLGALDFTLPAKLSQRLEQLSRPELVHPYLFFETEFFRDGLLSGGTRVRAEPPWFRGA